MNSSLCSTKLGLVRTTMVAGLLSVLASALPAFAIDIIDDPVQIDERVAQVMQSSNSLCWEIYRHHQQQPNFQETYRAAKGIWTKASQLKDALWNGLVQSDVLMQQATELNQEFAQLEKTLSQWGDGDRSAITSGASRQRTIVRDGVEIDVPFIGVRVNGPSVVVSDDGLLQLQRLRLHANSHGSKRSLEREIAAVKLAITYLVEDAGLTNPQDSASPTPAPPENNTAPPPPKPEPTLETPKPNTP